MIAPLTKLWQRCVNVPSGNIVAFLEKLPPRGLDWDPKDVDIYVPGDIYILVWYFCLDTVFNLNEKVFTDTEIR